MKKLVLFYGLFNNIETKKIEDMINNDDSFKERVKDIFSYIVIKDIKLFSIIDIFNDDVILLYKDNKLYTMDEVKSFI
mgnify:CR=1 FL=1